MLRIRLNQFETFVLSLIHEKNIEKCTVLKVNSVQIKPYKYIKYRLRAHNLVIHML